MHRSMRRSFFCVFPIYMYFLYLLVNMTRILCTGCMFGNFDGGLAGLCCVFGAVLGLLRAERLANE